MNIRLPASAPLESYDSPPDPLQAGQLIPAARWSHALSTLADPLRLRVLHLLGPQELAVGDLCLALQSPQSTVSRHLKLLANDGWIVSRREGTTRRYQRREDELSPAHAQLWQFTRERTRDWPELEQDRLRLAAVLAERDQDPAMFFAGAAAEWDRLREALYGQTFSTQALLALLPRDWTVADLGCGTGIHTAALADHVHHVHAVDNAPAMLEAARARTAHRDNVTLHDADLTALPLADASVDAALLVLTLTYLQDPAPALAQAARILKPAGQLVILDLLRHDRDDFRRRLGQRSLGFTPDDLRHHLQTVGLTPAHLNPLPTDPHLKAPALLLATAYHAQT